MINQTHVSDEEAGGIQKALEAKGPDLTSTADEVISFYINDKQYTEVHIVRCNKCGADMCLEVLNPNEVGRHFGAHHRGMRRIVLGTNGPLLSSRKRLDGLMGYRCGNLLPNPAYEKAVDEANKFNQKQAKLREKGKPFVADMEVSEPPFTMCGNNTIIAEIEKGLVPQVKAPVLHIPTIEPHHEAMIKLQMSKHHHKPDIEISHDGKTIRQESFTTERLK